MAILDISVLRSIFAGIFLNHSGLVAQLLLCMPHRFWSQKCRQHSVEFHVNTVEGCIHATFITRPRSRMLKKAPIDGLSSELVLDLGTTRQQGLIAYQRLKEENAKAKKGKKKQSVFTKCLPDWLRLFWTLSVACVKNGPFTKIHLHYNC